MSLRNLKKTRVTRTPDKENDLGRIQMPSRTTVKMTEHSKLCWLPIIGDNAYVVTNFFLDLSRSNI